MIAIERSACLLDERMPPISPLLLPERAPVVFSIRLFNPPTFGGFFYGAPGRAHPLGGESPLPARQGEGLAEGKGSPGDWRSEGSWVAKRWPDEQEADMRRGSWVRRP